MQKITIQVLLSLIFAVFISKQAQSQSNEFEALKSLEIMDQIYEHLDQYFVDDVQQGKLAKVAIDAMLNELDPYTVYYHEANIEDYKLMTTGQYGGIGAQIRTVDGAPFIVEIYEGNPAQLAGLMGGDQITGIDKKPVKGKSTTEVSDMLKGPKGTKVLVSVSRLGASLEFDIVRDEIKIADVPYSGLISPKVGYISLSSFTQTASESVKKKLIELQAQGIESLILDLRDNGGGLLIEAVKIVNLFIDKGQMVVSTKGRTPGDNFLHKTLENPIAPNLPLVVLIDNGSASASEIVAGALQDLDRAVVIGSTSYGKGLVQRTFDLKYGSKMKLTVAKYYTPSGRCVQRLEYYDKDNGEKPKEIPDSLLQKFKTKNGRTVIDGRGIEPDVSVSDSLYSDFTQKLILNHFFLKYATQFCKTNPNIAGAESFTLSTQEFDAFKKFVANSEFKYQSEAHKILDKLIASLKESGDQTLLDQEILGIQKKLEVSVLSLMDKNQSDIIHLLENEIIGRFYFQKGKIIHSFKFDRNIKNAESILSNSTQYKKVLGINP